MKNCRIILLAVIASFGVYATGNHNLSIDISPEMMAAANTALQEGNSSKQQEAAKQFAASIAEFSKSEAFREKQQSVKGQVLRASGLTPDATEEQGPKLAGNQLVMFVSSSMPLTTLRNYARDLSKVGGVMVMRGTVGGISKMGETINLTRNVLNANPSCEGANCKMWGTEMLIDPVLFRLYGISKVPALIYQPDMHIQSYCDGLEKVNKTSTVVYGDASVHRLLERMNLIAPEQNLKKLIERLEKS